jgi:hypothetical protein
MSALGRKRTWRGHAVASAVAHNSKRRSVAFERQLRAKKAIARLPEAPNKEATDHAAAAPGA